MSKIILEINRNRELMGLPLITEGVPPFDIIQVLMKWMGRDSDEIITDVFKKTDFFSVEEKKLKDVFVGLSDEFGMSTDDLVKKIQSGQLSDARLDTVISKLMLIDEELYEKLFKIYIMTTPVVKQIDDTFKSVKNLIGSGQKKVTKYDLYTLQQKLEDLLRDSLDDPDSRMSSKVYTMIKQRMGEKFKGLMSELPEFSSPRQEAIAAIKSLEKVSDENFKNLTYADLADWLYMVKIKSEQEGELINFRNDLKRLYKEFWEEYKEEINNGVKLPPSLSQQNSPTVKTDVPLKSTENPIKPVSKVVSNTPPVTSKGWSKNVETESVGGFKINATLYGLEKIDS